MYATNFPLLLLGFVLALTFVATKQVDSNHHEKLKLPISMCDFAMMVEDKKVFVDKTDWIAEALRGPIMKLITRPRRFGKTTNLSMLKLFLQKDPMVEEKKLFAGLNILVNHSYAEIVKNHQHKYAVFEFSILHLCQGRDPTSFRDELNEHMHFWLNEYTIFYKQYLTSADIDYINVRFLRNSNATISRLLRGYFYVIRRLRNAGFKIAILMDEYDAPFNTAFEDDLETFTGEDSFRTKHHEMSATYVENKALMRQLILFFCKEGVNPHPHLVIFTGITYTSKNSIFSDMSNFKAYTVFDDDTFGPYFGFKKDEINYLIEKMDSNLKIKGFEEWYDGYHFGNVVIFNPYSVALTIDSKKFDTYWGNSGSLEIVQKLISFSGDFGFLEVYFLVSGFSLEKRMYPNLTYQKLFSSKETYWTLLTSAGYLDASRINETDIYRLVIPNKEVKVFLQTRFQGELNDAKKQYNTFLDAINKLESERTESLKNYLEKHFNDHTSLYHVNVNLTAVSLGNEFKLLFDGIERKKMFSNTTQTNEFIVYQLIVGKGDTVYTFHIAKINDTSAEEATTKQLLALPPPIGSSFHFKKGAYSKIVHTAIAFLVKTGEKSLSAFIKAQLQEYFESYFHHHR
ncbi:unnamed protein product [Bemisia tabaci]|uniref:AAA-ATPase-like domain-containing protein n=1 Tax=Bemisia tabaci TaxID=7038 RepID=A0A9P0AN48_BEMTA|nr:unnamed protein product [Bemisia tabaci]